MRIAFLADGRSVHTVRWVRYFADRGYDVHLITFTAKPIKGVKIHELRYFSKLAYPLRILEVRKAIKKIDPDILHAHYISHYGVYGALTGFHPLVLTPWGSDIMIEPQRSRIKRFFIGFALKRADLVQISTKIGRKRLIELGCDPRKMFVQQWGVDTNKFSPKARSRSLRKSLGIDNVYSILCARYWSPVSNVEVFIKAVPLVLKKTKNVKFIMLGGGPLGLKLEELARNLGVYEDILFVGRVPENEMPKYLASVDLYVDTYSGFRGDIPGRIIVVRETSGVSQTTRQAMACGTPQILSDRPGTKSLDWVCGVTYRPLDHRDLAETIVQLLKNAKTRGFIGKKSRKNALEIFDQEKVMKQWEVVYHKLKSYKHAKRKNDSALS